MSTFLFYKFQHQFSEDARDSLDGVFVKGRFGLSVASLKDMNRDGYEGKRFFSPHIFISIRTMKKFSHFLKVKGDV